jgi:catechol 2,3-dioxygenase-like lactoylglutathione lyase family enzyme
VELLENTAIDHRVQLHHIHWSTTENEAMRDWYVDVFGATPGSRIGQPAADLPGVNLTFAPVADAQEPTRGRVFDHVGFEVDNLEAFCRELEARGITLDRGYSEVASLGIAIAFLTDPWGTYIELTEGLDAVE